MASKPDETPEEMEAAFERDHDSVPPYHEPTPDDPPDLPTEIDAARMMGGRARRDVADLLRSRPTSS